MSWLSNILAGILVHSNIKYQVLNTRYSIDSKIVELGHLDLEALFSEGTGPGNQQFTFRLSTNYSISLYYLWLFLRSTQWSTCQCWHGQGHFGCLWMCEAMSTLKSDLQLTINIIEHIASIIVCTVLHYPRYVVSTDTVVLYITTWNISHPNLLL